MHFRSNAIKSLAMACALLVIGQFSNAQTASTGQLNSNGQPQQPDDCVSRGAEYHGVNPWVVRAILKVESNFNPNALNRNKNGSFDIGIAQYNSNNFKELIKFGVKPVDLMDACVGSYVAAWHLKKLIKTHGNNWFAIGAYNSATPCYNDRYSSMVWNTLLGWKVVSGQRLKVTPMETCDVITRRSGRSASQDSVVAFDSPAEGSN